MTHGQVIELARHFMEPLGLILNDRLVARSYDAIQAIADEHSPENGEEFVSEVVSQDKDSVLGRAVYEGLLQKRTQFFQFLPTFRFLSTSVLPQLALVNMEKKTLRIWCVGCSTGQEVYSLAMLLELEDQLFADWDIVILGTDLSFQAIERAKLGVYSAAEIAEGVPDNLRERFFEPHGDSFSVSPALRKRAVFRTMNALRPSPALGVMDLIFVRNVMPMVAHGLRPLLMSYLACHTLPHTVFVTGAYEVPPANPLNLSEIAPGARCWEPCATHFEGWAESDELQEKKGKAPSSQAVPTESELDRLASMLKKSGLFGNVPLVLLRTLCTKLELHGFAVGATLLRQGRVSQAFYILFEGSLPVRCGGGFFRKDISLGRLEVGDIFGETSLLLGQPCNATVKADEDVRAFVGSHELFEFLMNRHESFRQYIHELCHFRMEQNEETVFQSKNRKSDDIYTPGEDGECDFSIDELTPEVIERAKVESALMTRLKTRGGTPEATTVQDFVRLSGLVRDLGPFQGLQVTHIEKVAAQIQLWSFPEESRILKQNERGMGLFVVDRGQLVVEHNRTMLQPGLELGQIRAGDVFGEMSLVSFAPTTADVVSTTPVRIYVIGRKLYYLLAAVNPEFATGVKQICAARG